MITVTREIQGRFFDRQAVIESIGRSNARRLSRMGAFVRTRAQKDILRRATSRRRPRRSAARGRPPLVHSRDSYATLKNIRFGLGSDNASVVIGPLRVGGRRKTGSAKTVPELLTHGGSGRVEQYSNDGDVWRLGSIPQAPHHRTVRARYHPHPFMGPALDKEIAAGTVANVWSAG